MMKNISFSLDGSAFGDVVIVSPACAVNLFAHWRYLHIFDFE